jgi:hypothetical protein
VPVRVVLAAGVALVAGLLAFLLLGQGERRAGSNYVPEFGPAVTLSGAGHHCEQDQVIPADTGALNLLIGTYGRPTPAIRVTARAADNRLVTSGTLPAGRHQGRLLVPVTPVRNTVNHATVCLQIGSGGPTVLYGRGRRIRVAWMREGSESRLAMLPTIAHRFGLAKLNPFGSWLLLLVALVLAVTWAIALRTVLREVGP